MRRVFVVGVAVTKFLKPAPGNPDYPVLVKEAVTSVLKDARSIYSDVEQAVVGYVYGETTSGQRALYELGPPTGIPIFNVNNNCSTGATALLVARNLVLAGSNCVLAVGFEKMEKTTNHRWTDRASPFEKYMEASINRYGKWASPPLAQMFGNAAREHMEKYGTTREHFAKIAQKNHSHSKNNPNAQFHDLYTINEIMKSPTVHDPLTKLQCAQLSDGAAGALIASEEFVIRRGLEKQAVEILAIEMATDTESSLNGSSCISAVGFDMTKQAADRALTKTNIALDQIQMVELHDSFSASELIAYEALGLCPVGKAGQFIDKGDNTYGGKFVVNPSGGLISKGHPLGATGLSQCAEICWQLRVLAGPCQVPGAKIAMQHNMGLGGAAIVALYQLGFQHTNENLMKSTPVFEEMSRILEDKTRLVELKRRIPGVICFRVLLKPDSDNFYCWTVDLKSDPPSVGVIKEAHGDCILTISDEDMVALKHGRLTVQKALSTGRLKVTGVLSYATWLHLLLQKPFVKKHQS